jgi:hypothetical protein
MSGDISFAGTAGMKRDRARRDKGEDWYLTLKQQCTYIMNHIAESFRNQGGTAVTEASKDWAPLLNRISGDASRHLE